MYILDNLLPDIWSNKKIMRWVGHTARRGDRRSAYRYWCGELRETDYLKDPDVDGRIISKGIFKKWNGKAWSELIWLGIRTGGGLL